MEADPPVVVIVVVVWADSAPFSPLWSQGLQLHRRGGVHLRHLRHVLHPRQLCPLPHPGAG